MVKITVEEVKKLAQLSKLALSDQEIEQYQLEMEKILAYVEQLNEIDTTGIEPTSQITGLTNVMRPDEVSDYGVSREALLQNAPVTEKGYIKVRRVL